MRTVFEARNFYRYTEKYDKEINDFLLHIANALSPASEHIAFCLQIHWRTCFFVFACFYYNSHALHGNIQCKASPMTYRTVQLPMQERRRGGRHCSISKKIALNERAASNPKPLSMKPRALIQSATESAMKCGGECLSDGNKDRPLRGQSLSRRRGH